MPKNALSKVPTIEHESFWWGDDFTGSPENLIAAGAARLDQFPGQPGRGKFTCTFYAGERVRQGVNVERDENYLSIRRVSRGRFMVRRGASHQEQEVRRQAQREKAELAKMISSHEQYRANTLAQARWFFDLLVGQLGPNETHGYRFDNDTVEEVSDLLGQVVDTIQCGDTRFCKARETDYVTSVKAKTAKADAPLQRFLSTLASANATDA